LGLTSSEKKSNGSVSIEMLKLSISNLNQSTLSPLFLLGGVEMDAGSAAGMTGAP